jgi:hypothetical protein
VVEVAKEEVGKELLGGAELTVVSTHGHCSICPGLGGHKTWPADHNVGRGAV